MKQPWFSAPLTSRRKTAAEQFVAQLQTQAKTQIAKWANSAIYERKQNFYRSITDLFDDACEHLEHGLYSRLPGLCDLQYALRKRKVKRAYRHIVVLAERAERMKSQPVSLP